MGRTDDSTNGKRDWRERLGVGKRDFPTISGQLQPKSSVNAPVDDTVLASSSSATQDAHTTQDTLAIKLRSQRDEANRQAVERVTAATERAIRTLEKPQSKSTYRESSRSEGVDPKVSILGREVFVIHGRNHSITESMHSFLRSINLRPTEFGTAIHKTIASSIKSKPNDLAGNPNIGVILDTIFQKAEILVVLLTPDDMVSLRPELWGKRESAIEKGNRYQPRPNVLFEAGIAVGRHPNKTILVTVGHVKSFSDIAGLHMLHLDNTPKMRRQFANRLKSMGCDVDLEGDDWERVGNFRVPISKAPRATPSTNHSNSEAEKKVTKKKTSKSHR